MQAVRDVVYRAPGVQIGCFAYHDDLACRQLVREPVTGLRNAPLRFAIEGNRALPTGGGTPAATLLFDELEHRQIAVADDLRRAPDGSGDHSEIDHDDAPIVSAYQALDHYFLGDAASLLDGLCQGLGTLDAHEHPAPLFTAHRLDDDRPVVLQKGGVVIGPARDDLLGHRDANLGQDAACDAFVVAPAHGDGTRQLGQRFAATDRTSAEM